MKTAWRIGIVVLLAAGLGRISPAAAQGVLDRLESGIRMSNGQPAATIAAGQRVYLGAVADDDAGRGVRVLSVRAGGPADRAGLKAQDLVVTAAGRKVHLLSELTNILSSLAPGDRLSLELMRGNRMVKTEVVVAAVPGIAPLPPPTSLGPGRTGRHTRLLPARWPHAGRKCDTRAATAPPPESLRYLASAVRCRQRGRHSAFPLRSRLPP